MVLLNWVGPTLGAPRLQWGAFPSSVHASTQLANTGGSEWVLLWAGLGWSFEDHCGSAFGVSDRWPGHEQQVGVLARELGFRQVSLSSEVMPMVRVVPRGYTACADAYLTPCILRYLDSFRAGFASQLQVRRRRWWLGEGGFQGLLGLPGGSRLQWLFYSVLPLEHYAI